jgi:hypothetical protein
VSAGIASGLCVVVMSKRGAARAAACDGSRVPSWTAPCRPRKSRRGSARAGRAARPASRPRAR